MSCDNSNGDGCVCCAVWLFRHARQTEQDRGCPGDDAPGSVEMDGKCNLRDFKSASGFPMLLLTSVAFVLPVVVSIVTVQAIESHAGSLSGAIAGVIAAGLTAATSAGIVKRLACRPPFMGAGQ